MHLAPLARTSLQAATALLVDALPHDRIDVVAEEKLFGDDGARTGVTTGAWDGDELVGVCALAERYIKVLAVAERHRHRGVGTQLLALATPDARVGDHPGNYLSPGVDVRYTDGLAWLVRRGFHERGQVENIRADYTHVTEPTDVPGYRLGRPTSLELPAVLHMVTTQFAPVWAKEIGLAAHGPRRALFSAWTDEGVPVAFACADGNNQGLGWFGPAGTLPAHRGKKLGEALLRASLLAVHGLPEAGVIAWIGPKAFYARAVGAVDDRRFVQLERQVEAQS